MSSTPIFLNSSGTPELDVSGFELLEHGGYWRWVSHKHRLATAGWGTREVAERYASGYLATVKALGFCRERYRETYGS